MSRKFLIPLIAAAFVTAPAFAPAPIAAELSGSAQAVKNLNSSRSNIRKKPTTVKSSKSNTSDRMGGGGGGKGAVQLNPQPEPPGRAKAK